MPGGSPTSVQKALRSGRIAKNAHGKLDPKKCDADWAANTDPSRPTANGKGQSKPARKAAAKKPRRTAKAGGKAKASPEGESYSKNRAEREHYAARKARLDYERAAGNLIDRATYESEAYRLGRETRDSVLSVPDQVSDQLAAESDPHKCHEILHGALARALETLADVGRR